MMDSLIKYIYTILFYIIFVVILEMILPKNNNSKYVKLVLGLILTFIIISPITKLFSNVSNIGSDLKEEFSRLDFTYNKSIDVLNQDVYVENILKNGLETDIKNRVESYGYIADNVEVKYDKNEKGEYGAITYISFRIVGEKQNNDFDVQNINEVDNIDIRALNNSNELESNKEKIVLPEKNKQDILKNISDRYEIDISKINII